MVHMVCLWRAKKAAAATAETALPEKIVYVFLAGVPDTLFTKRLG